MGNEEENATEKADSEEVVDNVKAETRDPEETEAPGGQLTS